MSFPWKPTNSSVPSRGHPGGSQATLRGSNSQPKAFASSSEFPQFGLSESGIELGVIGTGDGIKLVLATGCGGE